MRSALFFAVAGLLALSGCATRTSGFDATPGSSTTRFVPGIYEVRGTVQVPELYGRGAAGLSTRVRSEHVAATIEVREDGTRRVLNPSHRGMQVSVSRRTGAGTVSVVLSVPHLEEGQVVCVSPDQSGACRYTQREYYQRYRDVRLSGPAWIESGPLASR